MLSVVTHEACTAVMLYFDSVTKYVVGLPCEVQIFFCFFETLFYLESVHIHSANWCEHWV
jgi:hypothetical protein